MNRNFLYNILLATSLVGISACSNDVADGAYSVGEANNEIRFATGVVSANTSRAASRANYDVARYQFLPLAAGTKVHVKTEGAWTGKSDITHYTQTGTAKAPVADAKESEIEGVGIYWDDYGIGDPANSTNRTTGINVYAACVDGKGASAIGTISNWESLSLTLPTDMSTWKDKDLLFSNNNSDNAENVMNKDQSGRYKFDTQKGGAACNLELHHAMSKITVNLKARKGFPVVGGVAKFENTPTVTLCSMNLAGTVNIKTLAATATGTPGNAKLLKADEATESYTATLEGLIFPGNALTDTHKATAKRGGIATINCDGNIFTIYADELMDAMNTADEDYIFHSGKNYILNITVNKTEIKVAAYVTDWLPVTANVTDPKIEVTTDFGTTGTSATGDFSLYLSDHATPCYGTLNSDYYVANATTTHSGTGSETVWSLSPNLYWPNHTTAYHFRGIMPMTGATGNTEGEPVVVMNDSKQVIAVENVAYAEGTYPSDLMIGMPDAEPTGGITATEGTVKLNFKYMMSQVIVKLETSSTDDKVNLGTDGETETYATVEIVGGKTAGNVQLDDLACVLTGDAGNYTMHATSNVQRHDAVCPQALTDLKFKITVKNTDGTIDTYTTPIKDILVKEGDEISAHTISAWQPGKKYTYTLHVTKTQIKVTATIKDWITVQGSQQIWF